MKIIKNGSIPCENYIFTCDSDKIYIVVKNPNDVIRMEFEEG